MTRVLHVTDCYSTGVGRAIDTIVGLTPEHEHHLLWTGEDDPAGKGFTSTAGLPGSHLARVRATRAAVARTGADLVHAHSSRAGVYARATRLSVPVVYQPHAYKLLDPSLSAPARAAIALVERGLGGRTARVVVLSEEERRVATRLSPGAEQVLLRNAPSLAGLARGPVAERERSVVMSGRVSPQKDPGYLVEVARRLHQRDPGISVRWLGSADDPALAALLADAGVVVTGWLGPEALTDELARAGVYLHTAAYEGFPISVLDAAWSEVPVLVRSIPAFAGTALRAVGSPEQAARDVVDVLDGGPARAEALAGARSLLAEMNPQVQAARLAELYA